MFIQMLGQFLQPDPHAARHDERYNPYIVQFEWWKSSDGLIKAVAMSCNNQENLKAYFSTAMSGVTLWHCFGGLGALAATTNTYINRLFSASPEGRLIDSPTDRFVPASVEYKVGQHPDISADCLIVIGAGWTKGRRSYCEVVAVTGAAIPFVGHLLWEKYNVPGLENYKLPPLNDEAKKAIERYVNPPKKQTFTQRLFFGTLSLLNKFAKPRK